MSGSWLVPSESGLTEVAEAVVSMLQKGQRTGARVLFLKGEMGAGKTTFVGYLARALGGHGVQSPTYGFCNSYDLNAGTLYHWDLFRTRSLDDLQSTGFWDLMDQADANADWVAVEWPELLLVAPTTFPAGAVVLHLDFRVAQDGKSRIVEWAKFS